MVWAAAMERNTRLNRAIHTYARNAVGLGWEIVPAIDVTAETSEDQRKQIQEERAKLEALFRHPNHEMPFTSLMCLVKVDEEATGNGYMEVTRNNAGEIDGLYHAPSHTIRLLRGGHGFVQIRGSAKRYFRRFGDERVMDAQTAEFVEGRGLPIDRRATELIHFRIYSPRSSFYGIPRFVAAAPAIAGNRLAAQRNVAFFENDAVGRLAITVSGGRLTPDSIEMIRDFLRQGKGVENAHRVMILQSESKKIGLGNDAKTQINVIPLTVGVTEDASFLGYRKANDEEIREAFGIAKVFFTSDDVNRASAAVSRQITNEQEFEPDRIDKEFRINHTIVQAAPFHAELVEFRFARPTLSDPLDRARVDEIYARGGALTPNDLRSNLGLAPFSKDFAFANKPLAVALLELQAGLAAAPAAEPPTGDLIDRLLKIREELGRRVLRRACRACSALEGRGEGE
jgi:PBSX family phage portal protein